MEVTIFDELKAGADFNSGENKTHLKKFKAAAAAAVRDEYTTLSTSHVAPTLDFFGQTSNEHSNKVTNQRTKVRNKAKNKGNGKQNSKSQKDNYVSSDNGDDDSLGETNTIGTSLVTKKPKPKMCLLFSEGIDNTAEESSSGLSPTEELAENTKSNQRHTQEKHSNANNSISRRQRRAQVNAFRGRMNIRVKGSDICEPMETFKDMHPCGDVHIKHILLRNIERSLYKEPTPIQMQAVPLLLQRRDVLAAAPTGSGKTAAFVLPILAALAVPIKQQLRRQRKNAIKKNTHSAVANTNAGLIRSIIIAPTRELAAQIQREVAKLSEGKKFRSVVLSKATLASIATSATDVLVATPLRLQSALESGKLDVSKLQFFVLDEADKLFEMGFVEQLDRILALIKAPGLTRAFFSATLPEGIEDLARSVLMDPVRVVIGVRNAGASTIDQKLLFVGQEQGKLQAMRQLISEGLKPPCILFVQSKERAMEVFQELVYEGINVDVLHSDRTQAQRDRIVDQFRVGKIWVLIATDIVARGMDFQGVNTVINFDFPQSSVTYVHRIGRTGRAGRKGKAITFFTEVDFPALRSIANVMKLSGCEVPAWMLRLKTMKTKEKRRLRTSAPERHSIRTTSNYDKKRKAHRANMVKQTSSDKHKRKQARSAKHARAKKNGKNTAGEDDGGWTLVT